MTGTPNLATITFDHIRAAIALEDFDHEEAQIRMSPLPRLIRPENIGKPPREAGVLVFIYPETNNQWQVVLTERTSIPGDPHSGQVSFPGGHREPGDGSFVATALRETCEELGICEGIHVIGELAPIYIPPSHFQVYPIVGTMDTQPVFRPNPGEVAEVFTFPLDHLVDDQFKNAEEHQYWGTRVNVPFYATNGHKVWGATATMLSELEGRLRAVLI